MDAARPGAAVSASAIRGAFRVFLAAALGGCGSRTIAPSAPHGTFAEVQTKPDAAHSPQMKTAALYVTKQAAEEAAIAHLRNIGALPRAYKVHVGESNESGGRNVMLFGLPATPGFDVMVGVDKSGAITKVVPGQ
jgi:hypothetical protein